MARPRLPGATPEQEAQRQKWREDRLLRIRRDADTYLWSEQVALDAAAGVTTRESAYTLRLPLRRVAGMRSDPRVQERIADLRQMLREKTLARAAQVHDQLYDGVALAIEDGDGREVDSWTRAAASMERVRQSASGEMQPQAGAQVTITNAQVAPGGMTGEQLAALLEELGIGRRLVGDQGQVSPVRE